MVLVKNGCGFFCLGAQKSAVSQKWMDEMSCFFACWYKFRKAESCFDNYWVGIVGNGWGLIDHGSLKLGVSHNWFYELSRLIEKMHVDSDGIIFAWQPMYSVSLTFKCWVTPAVVQSQSF